MNIWFEGTLLALSHNEFLVLNAVRKAGYSSQRALSAVTGLSLGTVNGVLRDCTSHGYLEDRQLTEVGLGALAPYRVDNAVIMAAGFSSRFAPLSYERPKGVLKVRGEVLIERQIRQLQEAGITDITVVVGYMKEAFFYLEDLFGVTTVVNEQYATRNNNSTLMLVRDHLRNTFVCSSDNYFSENVFDPYVYEAYYSTTFVEGATDEYCVSTGVGGRIVSAEIGGRDSLVMLGHVYFDRQFSEAFGTILETEYDRPETAPKLWEDIYIGHLDELDMVAQQYPEGIVHEFDSLNDLVDFDQDFVQNVDSKILDNICSVLGCNRTDISDIVPIKEGLTNLSFRFAAVADGERLQYVYRHPGAGTEEIINRESETFSQGVARKLGIDDTFVYENPDEGWKISHYIEECVPFDYHNPEHVSKALGLIRELHRSGESSAWTFSVMENADELIGLLRARDYPSFPGFDELKHNAEHLGAMVATDEVEPCLCHNDFYGPNFLVQGDNVFLIDWEYSAMADYASDLGTFICCSDYTLEEAREVIGQYFDGRPTEEQMRHSLAYVSLCAYYWFIWALYKESAGDPVGEWLYLWYKAAKSYGEVAIALYETAQTPVREPLSQSIR